MDKLIYDLTDSLHSSEAYFSMVVQHGNTLIIPYVNIGFAGNIYIDKDDRYSIFADFSYLVCKDITYLSTSGKILINEGESGEVLYIGGSPMDEKYDQWIDTEVIAKTSYVYLLDRTRLRKEIWIAIEHEKRSISQEECDLFFSGAWMPQHIKVLIG